MLTTVLTLQVSVYLAEPLEQLHAELGLVEGRHNLLEGVLFLGLWLLLDHQYYGIHDACNQRTQKEKMILYNITIHWACLTKGSKLNVAQ